MGLTKADRRFTLCIPVEGKFWVFDNWIEERKLVKRASEEELEKILLEFILQRLNLRV